MNNSLVKVAEKSIKSKRENTPSLPSTSTVHQDRIYEYSHIGAAGGKPQV